MKKVVPGQIDLHMYILRPIFYSPNDYNSAIFQPMDLKFFMEEHLDDL